MSHTPGEWKYDEATCLVTDQNGHVIAELFGMPGPELDANGRLIAAAPKLLAACQASEAADQAIRFGNWAIARTIFKRCGWDGEVDPIAFARELRRDATSEGGDDSVLPVQ